MKNDFIPYQQALDIIAQNAMRMETVSLPITAAGGAVLDEDLVADRDFPPFDRVTMDGIAICYKSYANGQRAFPISAIAAAGAPQSTLADPTQCIEIMTGAMMPHHADTVIPYEDIIIENGVATLGAISILEQQNIHFKASDVKAGAVLVRAGIVLSSAEINIAAAVGKANIKVKKMPKAVIISTGDELVDVHQTPALHQIRRSNVYGIKNTLAEWGISADLAHLNDEKESILQKIKELLAVYDFFVITGGVSKGKYDFLPQVLEELGVEKHFHKIQQRPGKPFWFGTSANNKRIFALPGNPVSSFVCLYAYVKYWLQTSLGVAQEMVTVILDQEVHFQPHLIYFLEAKIHFHSSGKLIAAPIKGNGSGDFANLVHADGFLILPQEQSHFKKGAAYPFIAYRKIGPLL